MSGSAVRIVVPRRLVLAGGMAMAGALSGGRLAAETAGGEGEGGEGAAMEDGGTVALLTALGLVEGHLRAGSALYQAGQPEMALTHKKHPSEEIYTDLAPMLEAVGAPGFAAELEALAETVSTGAPADAVAAAETAALAAIEVARQAAGPSAAETAEAIERLVRTAAEEYAIGIVDGAVSNVHEYQDAWGFVQVAKAQAAVLGAAEPEVAAKISAALAETDMLFPDLAPAGNVDGKAGVLQGAAARIELARLELG
jgi:hypothetical protein